MDFSLRLTFLSALILHQVDAFGSYKSLIPNGNSVLNPCSSIGLPWSGVGHRAAVGRGPLNAFGTDFQLAGRVWTTALCNKDSDGDGNSNGVELGDPTCQWVKGQPIALTATGHPGICEPIGSPQCRHQVIQC